jgi:nucleotide-binding universal stress UspA family protein
LHSTTSLHKICGE